MAHWYKWFPGDYQRDTNHLSFVEDAAYRRLLDAYHSTGKLPANAENLLRICRAITPVEQEAVKRVATEFFCEECGLLIHHRVEAALTKMRITSEVRSQAGKLGAAVTNARMSANAAASEPANTENVPGKNPSIPEPEPEYKEPTCSPSARELVDEKFEAFWLTYPKKVGKTNAQKAWRKLKPAGQPLTDLMAGLERQKATEQWRKDDGQFIPHPATWLNGRRWEDELSLQQPGARSAGTAGTPRIGERRIRFGIEEEFDPTMGWIPRR